MSLSIEIEKRLADFRLSVSLVAERGITAILGPSGSGKTMTLLSVAGLVHPDKGRITSNGRTLFDRDKGIWLKPQERSVGFVFQNYALFPHLNCYDNIAFGIRRLNRNDRKEKIISIMEKINIAGLSRRFPGQISAGQQQRVALARALVTEPDILLLDEPFSALDTITKVDLEREFIEIGRSFPGYILFVTHNLAEAYRLSRDIAVFEAGRVIQSGPKRDILRSPATRTVAELTGVKNIWEGEVLRTEGTRIIVRVPALDGDLAAAGPAGLRKGQKVLTGIRGEDLVLADQPVPNTFTCTVSSVLEEVASCLVFLRPVSSSAFSPIEMNLTDKTLLPSPGQACLIKAPEDRVFIIPCDNG